METEISLDFRYENPRSYWTIKKDKTTGIVTVYPGDSFPGDFPRIVPMLSGDSWSHEDAAKYELGSRIIDWFKETKENNLALHDQRKT